MAVNSILVVCEGNICRSPMGEAILASALPHTRVRSAGLGALVGEGADPLATQLMAERGIDLGTHRAQQISRLLCQEADLVLVMDDTQRRRVEDLYPQLRGRVFRAGHHIRQDVPDPYRQGQAVFRDSLARLDAGLREWLLRIEKL